MSIIHLFEGQEVRFVGTWENPEWIAADVCEILGIVNHRDALSDFEEYEAGVVNTDTRSENGVEQSRQMLTVKEPGLYRLTTVSRKPEAKRFKKWVFGEVLPSIRKTGSYSIVGYQSSQTSVDLQVISELSGNINIFTLSYQTLSKLMEVSHFRRNPELIRWNNLAFCKALEGINPVLLEMSADAATYLWAKFCIETDCYKKSLESTDPFVVDITKNAVKEHQKIVKKPKYIKAAQEFQNQLDRQPITALQEQRYKLFVQSCQVSGDAEIDKSLRKEIYDLSNKVDKLIIESSLSLAASNAQQQISGN